MIAAIYARTTATLLLCALTLTGCVSTGRLSGVLPAVEPATAAEVVVVREWRYLGGGSNLMVTLNHEPVFGLGTDQHVVFQVPPGEHVIGIMAKGPFTNEETTRLTAEPGKRYYYRIETTGGVFAASWLIQPIAPHLGQQLMSKTMRVQ
jgi:hypothetical protein